MSTILSRNILSEMGSIHRITPNKIVQPHITMLHSSQRDGVLVFSSFFTSQGSSCPTWPQHETKPVPAAGRCRKSLVLAVAKEWLCTLAWRGAPEQWRGWMQMALPLSVLFQQLIPGREGLGRLRNFMQNSVGNFKLKEFTERFHTGRNILHTNYIYLKISTFPYLKISVRLCILFIL